MAEHPNRRRPVAIAIARSEAASARLRIIAVTTFTIAGLCAVLLPLIAAL